MDWWTKKYYSINSTIKQQYFSQGKRVHIQIRRHIHTVAVLANCILLFWKAWYFKMCVLYQLTCVLKKIISDTNKTLKYKH